MVDVIDFAVVVASFFPAFGQRQLLPGHLSRQQAQAAERRTEAGGGGGGGHPMQRESSAQQLARRAGRRGRGEQGNGSEGADRAGASHPQPARGTRRKERRVRGREELFRTLQATRDSPGWPPSLPPSVSSSDKRAGVGFFPLLLSPPLLSSAGDPPEKERGCCCSLAWSLERSSPLLFPGLLLPGKVGPPASQGSGAERSSPESLAAPLRPRLLLLLLLSPLSPRLLPSLLPCAGATVIQVIVEPPQLFS